MGKYLVSGYWNSNLGDDLFLKILIDRYPNEKFYIFIEKNNYHQFSQYDNVIPIYNNFFIKAINKMLKLLNIVPLQYFLGKIFIKNCIEIGGSIFMENDNWLYKFKQREYVASKYKKYFILGSNFGPFYSEDYYLAYKKVFKKLNGIVFRDEYSYQLFKDENVKKASDVIFNLYSEYQNEINKKKQVVISIVDYRYKIKGTSNDDQIRYEKKISEMILNFLSNGYHVVIMSFCKSEGDEAVAENIYYELNNKGKSITLFNYSDDIDLAIKLVAEAEIVVASRFHAVVLGLEFGANVLPITYSDKTKHLIQDIYHEKRWLTFDEFINSNITKFDYVYMNERMLISMINDAERQFYYLDDFIDKRS